MRGGCCYILKTAHRGKKGEVWPLLRERKSIAAPLGVFRGRECSVGGRARLVALDGLDPELPCGTIITAAPAQVW